MRSKRLWITVSLICVILGTALLTAGRMMGGRAGFYIDNNGIHTSGSTKAPNPEPARGARTLDAFNRIDVDIDYADVEVAVSDKFAIEYCIMGTYGDPVCEVRHGTLTFKEAETLQIYNVGFFDGNFGIMTGEPRYFVRIEIPEDTALRQATFDIESGNLDIAALHADKLNIQNEYGDVCLDQFTGEKLDILMESGDLICDSMSAVHAGIENEYGNIQISEADGNRLTVQMDSCDCKIDRADFVNIEISDSYGDVRLGLPGDIKTYGFDLSAEYGEIRVGNKNRGRGDDWDEVTYSADGNGRNSVTVSCESGNIDVKSVK